MSPVTRAKLDLIFSVAVFGTIGIFVRSIPLPSSVIALVRGAVGAAFLLLLARLRHTPIDKASLRRQWKLLVLSAAMMSFNWITLFEAYRYTTVATATLCYYMAPIFVTLASPFVLKERLTARKLFCVCLALTGMVPVIMLLVILWALYDRECAMALTVLGASLFVLWGFRRYGASMYVGTAVKVCVAVYLVVLAALAWLTKSGKLSRILSPKADKLPVYAACGLSGLALLAAFLGTGVSYYAMWALAAVVFALAVYYTVKQL